jgi:hypothetical protein
MALRRRKEEPVQLALFSETPPRVQVVGGPDSMAAAVVRAIAERATEVPAVKAACEEALKGCLPGPMTADEAVRTFHGHEYIGFCTADGRCVCLSCIKELGAMKARDGRPWHHYLWPPRHYRTVGGEPVVDFKIARCGACGCQFSVEPCEFMLEPPAA